MTATALAASKPKVDLRHALLAPTSVALIGASDDETKTTSRPLRFLREEGSFTHRPTPQED